MKKVNGMWERLTLLYLLKPKDQTSKDLLCETLNQAEGKQREKIGPTTELPLLRCL